MSRHKKLPEGVDWVFIKRKVAVYCRPHGGRVVGFFNQIPMCQKCADRLVTDLKLLDELVEAHNRSNPTD